MRKLSLFILAVFAVLSAAFAADAPLASPNQKQGLKTVNINDIREFDPKNILKKVPFDADKMVFNTYFLEPAELLRLHKHPDSDEYFYLAEGEGQFTVGNDQVMIKSGAAVYGPAGVAHGFVNSGGGKAVLISVQGPTPVKIASIDNSSAICPVCGQENIIPEGAKEGDIVTCPRCHAKFKLSKGPDGKWLATKI